VIQKVVGLVIAIAVLAGGGAATYQLTRPPSITIEEQGVALEPGAVRAIHAYASGGLPFRDAVSWGVVPSWLGTINERGEFRAGAVTGSGTLSARFGSASAKITVTVTCPREAQLQGVRFEVACSRLADVYVDVIAYGGAKVAAAAVDRSADRVSRDLQIPSDRRFRVYYFGSAQRFAIGVGELGGGFTSGPTGFEGEAVYFDTADAIAIDQSADPLMQTEGALQHELVHRFVRQVVGYANIAEIPTWLNEGWAFLEESSQTGRLRTEARLVSASMAHVDKLPSLRSLISQRDWNARRGVEGLYQYYAAAQATQFLIDDIKLVGVLRILKNVRDGDSFAEAFAKSAPGANYDDFMDRFPDRVAALELTLPGMVAVSGTPYGPGMTVIAYGLSPNASATLRAIGPIKRELSDNVDAYGVFVEYIGAEFPAGEYVVSLETPETRLSVTARR
jgi:hypothetical protein